MKNSIRLLTTVTIGVACLSTPNETFAQLYDLKADWSDGSNPNGVWSYLLNGSLAPLGARGGDPFGTPPPIWGDPGSPWVGWSKSNGSELFTHDWIAGDVFGHMGSLQIRWTSPTAGFIDVTGDVWPTRDIGRFSDWFVTLNGNPLASGVVGSGDPYSRSSPLSFAALNLAVNCGDILEFSTSVSAGSISDYIAVNLTVNLSPGVGDACGQPSPVLWSGNCHYYEFVSGMFTWQEARAAALSRTHLGVSGHLVTITSAGENAFINAAFNAAMENRGTWIGAYEPAEDGVWRWADGPEAGVQFSYFASPTAPFNYVNWGGVEPDNGRPPDERYAWMNIGAPFPGVGSSEWADSISTPNPFDPIVGYIVEYSPPDLDGNGIPDVCDNVAPQCSPLPSGLVAWWPGDGNANDVVGGNHGTVIGGVTFAPGLCGDAFDFRGSGYVSIPEAAAFDFGSQDSFTVLAWVYRTGEGIPTHFFGKRPGCGGGGNFYQAAIGFGALAETDVPLQQWTLVAITYDRCTVTYKQWANNQVRASSVGEADPQNDSDLRIGTSGSCEPFDGLLDNMMIFNRALTQQDMSLLYTLRCDAVCLLPSPSTPCDDTTAPTLACPPNVTVQCSADVPPANFAGGSVSDDHDPDPTVTHEGDAASGNCPMTIIRTYKATDASGNIATCTQTITVNDTTAPVITCPPALTITSGSAPSAAISATAFRAQGGTIADNSDPDPIVTSSDSTHGDCIHVITRTYTVTDVCGNISVCKQIITVTLANSAPVITSVTGPSAPVTLGSSISITVAFTDADSSQSHICIFAWDDGGSDSVPVAADISTATKAHTFSSVGVYTIVVTVNDPCTGASQPFEFAVVYDPNGGGFVTGGGWISSPAGAYKANPALTGKANFGFVSKYQKGASQPSGETEFQFKAGDLNFHSLAYQWLVVAGAKAQYKGTGTINGAGNYTFLTTATDGQVSGGGGSDKFRIKIWNASGVIYDNVPGASDDMDTANPQVIGGGSIVILK